MEESKAISPEVKGLFDTIRSQAKEYASAFETLLEQRDDLNRLKGEISSLIEHIGNEADFTSQELKKQVLDTLNLIESKTDKIFEIYDDLDNIRDLKNSIQPVFDKLKKESLELETMLDSFRIKSDKVLESQLENIKSVISKELEHESQKIEARTGVKIKQIQGNLINYDQKLWSLGDTHTRDLKSVVENMDLIKKKVLALGHAIDEINRNTEDMNKYFSKKIDECKTAVMKHEAVPSLSLIGLAQEEFMPPAGTKTQFSTAGYGSTKSETFNYDEDFRLLEKDIDFLKQNTSKWRNSIRITEKKTSIATTIAIISAILCLLELLLIFIK